MIIIISRRNIFDIRGNAVTRGRWVLMWEYQKSGIIGYILSNFCSCPIHLVYSWLQKQMWIHKQIHKLILAGWFSLWYRRQMSLSDSTNPQHFLTTIKGFWQWEGASIWMYLTKIKVAWCFCKPLNWGWGASDAMWKWVKVRRPAPVPCLSPWSQIRGCRRPTCCVQMAGNFYFNILLRWGIWKKTKRKYDWGFPLVLDWPNFMFIQNVLLLFSITGAGSRNSGSVVFR